MATTTISISKGVSVDTVLSVNNFDIPRIQSLLKPFPQPYARGEKIALTIPEQQADSREPVQDSPDEASLSQPSPSEKEALMEVLK